MIRSQPGVLQRPGLARKQRSVRRQGQLGIELGEHRDQVLDVPPDQRLTAGEADLVDAERDGRAGNPRDLVEVEQFLAIEEPVGVAEYLLRHAIGATEVAPIGHRDPEVPKGTAEGV